MNNRRKLIVALGASALAAPFGSLAQPPDKVLRVGVLVGGPRSDPYTYSQFVALREGLHLLGWVEGSNLRTDIHWGESNINVMQSEAAALSSAKQDLIAVSTATALRQVQLVAGKTPIVFWGVSDAVGNKFVESLAHPGSNTTGFSLFEYEMGGKWLQLLKEAAPTLKRVLILMNSTNPNFPGWRRAIESVASSLGLELTWPKLIEGAQIEPAISAFARKTNGGLLSLPDPFLLPNRELIVKLAAKYRLPSIYGVSIFAQDGGLISYGVDMVDLARRAATYVDKILKGANPGDLPIQRPTKFVLSVNMKTAKALGIKIPNSILVRADKVIE